MQQARFTADQYATVQAIDIERHQGLPAGIGSGPLADARGARAGNDPVRQRGGQCLALSGRQLLEPGTGNALQLQGEQRLLGPRCWLCVMGAVGAVVSGAGAEIHQAAAQAEEYGGGVGDGVWDCLDVGHYYIPEMIREVKATE
ncbi:hypothetical protein D3C78_805050 [compost metagenome]